MRILLSIAIILLIVFLFWVSGYAADPLTLFWTAPGDDGYFGQAAAYDMRVVAGDSTALWNRWDSLFAISGLPTPSLAGVTDSVCINIVPCGVDLYFAIKTLDEAFNISEISNVYHYYVDCPDTLCPGGIMDFRDLK
jgi:hypothetical protein